MGWWCGGPTATIDIPTSLCYGTAPGTALAVCFLLYIAMDNFTPGTVSAYMPAILPCCGAACAFVFVPVLVRGSRRIVVWYSVLVCCMLSRSRRCGVFPGGVPCGLLSFTVLLHSICSRWYSRQLPDRGDPVLLWWQLFPGSRSVAPAACYPSGAFCCVPGFFSTTIVPHYIGVLVRFLFKFQCFRGVPEKRLKNFAILC